MKNKVNVITLFVLMFINILIASFCVKTVQAINQKEINSLERFESIRIQVANIIKSEIKDRKEPLTPDNYHRLAEKLSKLNGVEWAEYSGDPLGTIYIKVKDGGIFTWSHIKNSFKGQQLLPKDIDFKIEYQLHPKWNKGWKAEKEVGYEKGNGWYTTYTEPKITKAQFLPLPGNLSPGRPQGETNSFATRLPNGHQDKNFSQDDVVQCPYEERIAIVDFLGSEPLVEGYSKELQADGVDIRTRIKWIGKAAGFDVDYFTGDKINLRNFNILEKYKIVIIFGHGSLPPPRFIEGRERGIRDPENLPLPMPSMVTREFYTPNNRVLDGKISYFTAWTKGYIYFDPTNRTISWTPLLFRDLYKPKTSQLFMLNNCFSMLYTWEGLAFLGGQSYEWRYVHKPQYPLYNFGEALMDAGVKVVMGYVTYSNTGSVVHHTMNFFRRLFGGYYINDPPPPPHLFWPTCMSAQTYFRVFPKVPKYFPKIYLGTIYTMYAVQDPQFFREVCDPPNRHQSLQSFMLRVGTPATAFMNCWDEYWSRVEKGRLKSPLCNMGELPTSEKDVINASCGVKISRKVTNAILRKE